MMHPKNVKRFATKEKRQINEELLNKEKDSTI